MPANAHLQTAGSLTLQTTSGDLSAWPVPPFPPPPASTRSQPASSTPRNATVTAQQLTAIAQSIDNSGGKLVQTGSGTMQVTSAGTFTNENGLTGSAGTLALNAARIDNRQGGQLQADRFSLATGSLDNHAGVITETGMQDGQFAVAGMLDNSQGTLASNAQDLTLAAAQVNNAGGQIILAGTGQLTVSASQQLDNSAGRIAGNGGVAVNAVTLANAAGQITAAHQLAVTTHTVDNTGGTLAAGTTLSLDNQTTLDNTSGVIEAGNGLVLHTGSLASNGTGRIVADAGDATITATGTISNAGLLGGNGNVAVQASQLTNSGTLTGNGNLAVTAGSIANSGATVAGNQLSLTAQQGIDNTGGTLQGTTLLLASQNLANAGGRIVQTGSTNGNWAISQTLDNRNGTILSGARDLDLEAASILNNSGKIGHAGSGTLTVSATGTLDNTAGQINGNGTVEIGNATTATGNVINQGGTIGSQHDLTVSAANINNSQNGTLTAAGAVTASATQTLDDTDGNLEAGTGLTINAGTLTAGGNSRIVTVAGNAAVTANALTNAGLLGGNGNVTVNAGQLTNSGTVTAGQALTVAGSTLANSGTLTGTNTAVTETGSLNNNGGSINASHSLNVAGNSISNHAGQIASSGTGQTTIHADGTLDNSQNGLIGGNGNTAIDAAGIDNSQQGTLTSGGTLTVTTAGNLNNNAGTLYAVGDSTINAASLDNTSGTVNGNVGLNTTSTANNNGRIASDNNITVTTNSLTGTGNINAGNDLALNLRGDVTYAAGQNWTANHDLTLNTNGAITNQGNFGAVGMLTLNGRSISNSASGQLSGNDGLAINTAGHVQNDGVMSGDQVSIHAGDITNTNAIFGGDVTLVAGQISNSGNGKADSAVIAAGRSLSLNANAISNTGGGDLYSMGNLTIAGKDGSSNAASVFNQSSTIEGDGNVAIHTADLRNQWDSIQSGSTTTSTAPVTTTTSTQPVPDPNVRPTNPQDGDTYTDTSITTFTTTAQAGASGTGRAGQILAGGDLTLGGGSILNDASNISAGGNFNFNQSTVSNQSYAAWQIVSETTSGTKTTHTYVVHNSGCGGQGCGGGSWEGWTTSTQIMPPATVQISNSALPGLSAVLSANGAISGNPQSISNITTNRNTSTVTGSTVSGNAAQTISGTAINTGAGTAGAIAGAGTGTGTPTASVAPPPGQPLVGNPVGPGYQLPASGLYKINTQPGQQYLVQTDPRFTQYGNFISSDYMLKQLGLDPAATEKRLGDAFYENKLVTDQIAQLTGKALLTGYSDKTAEYEGLMNAGVTFAQQFGITPGIALSAEQMASLTQDMVWLVSETVDGQSVLVPVVYLASVSQNVMQSGQAQISASSIDLHTGEMTNSGVIQSRTSIVIAATDISNLGGSITSLGDVQLTANGNLLNQSGTISGSNVILQAGQDLRNLTVAGQKTATIAATGDATQGNGNLLMTAGNDLTLTAANVSATGNAQISASHDLTVNTLATTTSDTQKGAATGNGWYAQDGSKTTTTQTTHQVSSITSGGNLVMTAGNDVTLTAAQIQAGGSAGVAAGHDLTIQTVADTSTTQNTSGKGLPSLLTGNSTTTQTTNETSSIATGGNLVITAGNDATLTGAQVNAGNNLALIAGGNVTVQAATDSASLDQNKGHGDAYHHTETAEQLVGSNLNAGNAVVIGAGQGNGSTGNLNITSSAVHSDNGAIQLTASGDVNIGAQTQTSTSTIDTHTHDSGLFSSSDTRTHDATRYTESVGSTISGDSVQIGAGHDLNVTGSNVVATNDVALSAKNDININAGTDTYTAEHASQSKTSGVFGGGGALTIGQKSARDGLQTAQTQHDASTIGSLNGNVTLVAGNDIGVHGSDLLAAQDIMGIGRNVTIDTVTDTASQHETHEARQSGLSLSVKSAILDTAQAVYHTAEQARNVPDDRLQALYASKAAVTGYANYDAAAREAVNLSNGNMASVSVQVSIGSSQSKSDSTTSASTTKGSHVLAGGDVILVAAGNKDASGQVQDGTGNLGIIGSQVAGNNVTLSAANDLRLASAQDETSQHSSNSNSGWSGGIGLSAGQQTGVTFSASGYAGKGKANGQSQTQTDTQVSANDSLAIHTGRDAVLDGAQASAAHISADIGRDLTVTSNQDTMQYQSDQKQVSAAASVTMGFGGSGTISANRSKADGNMASVNQQSGLFAGDGGYDVQVGNHTQLNGGAIVSTADAAQNHFSTETLGYTNIDNQSYAHAQSDGISVGTDMIKNPIYGAGKSIGGGLLAHDPENSSDHSTTYAVISPGTVDVRSGDTSALNTLRRDADGASRALTSPDVAAMQDKANRNSEAGTVLADTLSILVDDGIRKFLNPAASRVFCVQQPCTNDQVANNQLVQQRASQLEAAGMPADQAQQQALNDVLASKANPNRNLDANAVDRVRNGQQPLDSDMLAKDGQASVNNIQMVPIDPNDLQNLSNDQKNNSTVFGNGIFNSADRAAQLAMQQTPTDQKYVQTGLTGNTTFGDTYLVHTDKANNFIGEYVVSGIEKMAEVFGISTPAASMETSITKELLLQRDENGEPIKNDDGSYSYLNSVNLVGHSRGTMTESDTLNALAEQGVSTKTLNLYVNNPAADAQRLTDRATVVTPNTPNFWAPPNDPIATLIGGYPGQLSWPDIVQMYNTSYSVHSCGGAGAIGCAAENVNTNQLFSYTGSPVEQMNQTRQASVVNQLQQWQTPAATVPQFSQPTLQTNQNEAAWQQQLQQAPKSIAPQTALPLSGPTAPSTSGSATSPETKAQQLEQRRQQLMGTQQ